MGGGVGQEEDNLTEAPVTRFNLDHRQRWLHEPCAIMTSGHVTLSPSQCTIWYLMSL